MAPSSRHGMVHKSLDGCIEQRNDVHSRRPASPPHMACVRIILVSHARAVHFLIHFCTCCLQDVGVQQLWDMLLAACAEPPSTGSQATSTAAPSR